MEAIYSVPQNKDRKELLDIGTPLFPCEAYDRDVRQYVTGEIPPHWHYEMEIFWLVQGSAHVSFMNSEYDLKSGEGYFINSNVLHGISCPSGNSCHYHSMVFDPCILSGISGSAYDVLYLRPFIEQGGSAWILRLDDDPNAKTIFELFKTAFDAWKNQKYGYEFIIRNSLSSIFLLLKEHLQEIPRRRSSQQELRMKQMLSWLEEHYMEQITISQLADNAGICVRECQRTFSSILHTTPMQYLLRRRVTAAAELLLSTNLPISQAGLCCGFDNPSYFARQFKKITGVTPGEYRNKNAI